MESLINPKFAYVLLVTAVMLANMIILFPNSVIPKIGMIVCLGTAGYELFNLEANPWALLMMAVSSLPFFLTTYQSNFRRPLLVLSTGMLIFGSVFLFINKDGRPTMNLSLVPLISIFCALFILVAAERRLNILNPIPGAQRDSLVGITGDAIVEISDVGLVQVEGDTWSARSEQTIPAGSTVRILKQEGMILVVKKVEKILEKSKKETHHAIF